MDRRLAGAVLAVALLSGCGGAAPEPADAPVVGSAASGAGAVGKPAGAGQGPAAAAPSPPAPPARPVLSAPTSGAAAPPTSGTADSPTAGMATSPPPATGPTPPTPPAPPAAGNVAPPPPGAAPPPAPGATTPSSPGSTPPTAPATPVQGRALPITSLQRGAYSGITERKAVLISDEATWRANWQQLTARQVPAPEAPAMDFSQHSVLAVYMGEKRTGGYAIEVTGVDVAGGKLKVTVKQTAPGPGAIVTMALTQPYHMVRIPKVPAGTAVEVNW